VLDFILRACLSTLLETGREDKISFTSRLPLDKLGVARRIKSSFSEVSNFKNKEAIMSKGFFNKETDQINGLLDKGCSFEGKLTFDGVVQINGNFRGDIISDGTLVVGKDAHVHAKIMVDTLIVNGMVEGIIEAKNKVEIRSAAQILGDVITRGLVIEEGGLLQGHCQMQPAEQAHNVAKPAMQEEEFFVQSTDDPIV